MIKEAAKAAKRRAKAKKAKPPKPLSENLAKQRDEMGERNRARPHRPRSQLTVKDGATSVKAAEGEDDLLYYAALLEALGTSSMPFHNATMNNVISVMSPGRNVTADQYNAAVAIMAAVEPQNELEATLASQMVAANDCAMRCMRSMVGSDFVDHHKMYGDLANKFMRTFTAQFEALARVRRGGEQIVKHVHVNEGGQAVIAGTINQGRGVNAQCDEQPHGTGVLEESASLLSPDEAGNGVPISGDAQRSLSPSRRVKSGSTDGK